MIQDFAVGVMVVSYTALVWLVRKRLFSLALAVLLCIGLPVFGQTCNVAVTDDAGMFGSKIEQVVQAAAVLIDHGADVRVRTLVNSGGNLDFAERQFEQSCMSWQSPGSVRKTTLVTILISKDHRKGIYYGSAWNKALGANWQRVSDSMVPYFRNGDFATGVAQAEKALAASIMYSQAAVPGAVSTTTVVNQPTDVSGFWNVLYVIIFIGFFAGMVYFAFWWSNRRRVLREKRATAQQLAQTERNEAVSALTTLGEKFQAKRDAGDVIPPDADMWYRRASDAYNAALVSDHADPSKEGLTVGEYNYVTTYYRDVNYKLQRAERCLLGQSADPFNAAVDKLDEQTKPLPTPYEQPAGTQVVEHHHYHDSGSKVIVVDNSSSGYTTGLVEGALLESALRPNYVQPVYTPPPAYNPPAPEPEPESGGSSSWSSSSSSDSDSSGGGSSSWSDSSSSSDSGSSFDSGGGGGFDSGGGGGDSSW